MDPVAATSTQSFQCVESVVNAGMAGSACLTAVVTTGLAAPTGVGLAVGGVAIATACFGAGWYGGKADMMCSSDGNSGGSPPASGSDGMDHRNDPANAPWRSNVVIEPITGGEAMLEEEGFETRDSSF